MLKLIIFLLLLFLTPAGLVSAHSSTQVIEMTPAGFVPPEASVDQNTTIIFLNKDSKARWPASNIHPTHDIYPEFDPKRPIEPGNSWAFKPKKAGTWKYHDHLLPHLRGNLKVTSEGGLSLPLDKGPNIIDQIKEALSTLISRIKNIFARPKSVLDAASFKTFKAEEQIEVLKEYASSQGAEKTWQFIVETFKGEGGSSGNIHDLAHFAGSLIFQKKGFSGIGICSAEFAFGCFHGFLDEAFKKDLSKLNEAYEACSKLGTGLSGPVASCIHGMGHGVASFHGSTNLKAALKSCRELVSGHDYCFDGVFMEFARSAPENFYKVDNPLYPCNSLENEFGPTYSFPCGRNQPSVLMSRFKMGFDEVVGVCLNSSSRPFKEACFDALGFSLASSGDSQIIIQGCQKIGVLEYMLRCAQAGAGELVFQEVPNWQEKSEAVCNAILYARDDCLQYLDKLILEYGRNKKINFRPRQDEEDLNSYIRGEIKKCYDLQGRYGCYKDVATLFYDQFGLKKTLELLKTNEDYQEVYARCHEVTHYLSRAEYEKQNSISGVYSQCDSTCHGGCYHGTLEAFLKEKTADYGFNLDRDFSKICGKKDNYQKPIEFNECLHGLGHAAMFIFDMELKKSLALCDSLGDAEPIERCHTGAFMENSSSSTSFDHQSKYIKADDPFYPCNALEEKYQAVCWQYQSSYFSIINHQDWKKIAELCLQIPNEYQDRCFRTIGTNQVGFTTSLQQMKEDCGIMPSPRFKDVCVSGVVSSLSYRFVGDYQKIIDFCLFVDPENQESCFKQMGTGLLDWNTDKDLAKEHCKQISAPQGSAWCLSVI